MIISVFRSSETSSSVGEALSIKGKFSKKDGKFEKNKGKARQKSYGGGAPAIKSL